MLASLASCGDDSAPTATRADSGPPPAAIVDAALVPDGGAAEAALPAHRLDASDGSAVDAEAPRQPLDASTPRDAGELDTVGITPPYPDTSFPEANPFSPDKALLGKLLFWEEQLSYDDSVACGTCHRPGAGGSDARPADPGYLGHPGPDGTRGTEDDPRGSPGVRRCRYDDAGLPVVLDDPVFGNAPQVTRRRSMSAIDALLFAELFWDGRAGGAFVDPEQPDSVLIDAGGALETQAVAPLQNDTEMACEGFRWDALTDRLRERRPLAVASELPESLATALAGVDRYPALFAAAFGSPEITPSRIAFAIATYERTLRSDQTPWDRHNAGEANALDAAEERGLRVFLTQGRCACCHPPPVFGVSAFGNDGFASEVWDEGRAEVTARPEDRGAFRVPSLRNVGLREAAGLLHDGTGAGSDLERLVQRYSEDPVVPVVIGICVRVGARLDAEQQRDLLAFLRGGLTDPRVAAELPPFDRPRLGSE